MLLLQSRNGRCESEDKDGNTPLHMAAMTGRVESAEVLVEKGAFINAKIRRARGHLILWY